MSKTKWLLYIIALFLIASQLIPRLNLAKITIKVVDEQGKPVPGALVGAIFKYGHLTKDSIEGYSDNVGKFSITSRTPDGTIIGGASKKNYYDSGTGFVFSKKKFGFWLPWNEQSTVLLRPIVNPVPMYVRSRDWFEVPMLGKEIGFDLMVSDWVTPYGTGKIADFIFRLEYLYEGHDELASSMTLTFSNRYDGIQMVKQDNTFYSHYALPRTAPVTGYQAKLVKRSVTSIKRKEFINDHDDNNNYIFRVRTEVDKDGKILRAMYGKIRRDIGFSHPRKSSKAAITMHYYLNPDYTRNLEFDPERNLFSNLPKYEKVDLP